MTDKLLEKQLSCAIVKIWELTTRLDEMEKKHAADLKQLTDCIDSMQKKPEEKSKKNEIIHSGKTEYKTTSFEINYYTKDQFIQKLDPEIHSYANQHINNREAIIFIDELKNVTMRIYFPKANLQDKKIWILADDLYADFKAHLCVGENIAGTVMFGNSGPNGTSWRIMIITTYGSIYVAQGYWSPHHPQYASFADSVSTKFIKAQRTILTDAQLKIIGAYIYGASKSKSRYFSEDGWAQLNRSIEPDAQDLFDSIHA